MAVKPIPDGYHSVTPYLVVEGAEKLLTFLKEAFGAEEFVRMAGATEDKVGHAEVRIGDSVIMLADASESEQGALTQSLLHLYVDDADKTFQQALEAGATLVREPRNEFYGDRSGGVKDQFGNQWWISTHVEDVPPEEMGKRAEEWQKQQSQT